MWHVGGDGCVMGVASVWRLHALPCALRCTLLHTVYSGALGLGRGRGRVLGRVVGVGGRGLAGAENEDVGQMRLEHGSCPSPEHSWMQRPCTVSVRRSRNCSCGTGIPVLSRWR